MRELHVWREETIETDGAIAVSATIEYPDRTRSRLWYRLPIEYGSIITDSSDPFVLAPLLIAMNKSAKLVVHGEVSPSLLRNLEEFQMPWTCWCPDLYHKIEIAADVERDRDPLPTDKTIVAFSGGVDSCFTVFRHQTGRCGRWQRNIKAGLFVRGFDIPLEQEEVFDRATAKAKILLDSMGVELIPIATNFRELKQDWENANGTGVASCLMLLQGGYNTALIASGPSYNNLALPQGSNPIGDHFLSNNTFEIIHDGAGFSRLDKIREIADWPEALQNLRVCWEGSQLDRNCGRCEKCIRTILSFRVIGAGLPACFERDASDAQILGIKVKKAQLEVDFVPILKAAKAARISDSWVSALEKCISRNRLMAALDDRKVALKKQFAPAVKQWHRLKSLLKSKR